MPQEQNLKNHARIVPVYHVGVLMSLLLVIIWAIYRAAQLRTLDSAIMLLLAVALFVMAISVRTQILRVQDRVIRLEMRLRLQQLLSGDLQSQAARLTVPQLIALRFASDAELPGLVREVLSGSLASQKEIKTRIREWQADHQRA